MEFIDSINRSFFAEMLELGLLKHHTFLALFMQLPAMLDDLSSENTKGKPVLEEVLNTLRSVIGYEFIDGLAVEHVVHTEYPHLHQVSFIEPVDEVSGSDAFEINIAARL